MYYAVCWVSGYGVDKRAVGWSIHQTEDSAYEIKKSDIEHITTADDRTGQVYKVDVREDAFDEEFFMSVLSTGYAYIEQENPPWLSGSKERGSKCA